MKNNNYDWWTDPKNKEEINGMRWWNHPDNKTVLNLPISFIKNGDYWIVQTNEDTLGGALTI